MKRASNITENYPDSALVILDSINIYDLDEELFNAYNLLYVQSKDKAYGDITSDTIIFEVEKYYLGKKILDKVGLATYYSGRVLQEQKKYAESMNEYMEAEKYVKTNTDNLNGLIQGQIGQIFQKQLLPSKAIKHYSSAIEYFKKANNTKNVIGTYTAIGNNYLIDSNNDSAFYYYHKALCLAESSSFFEQIANVNMCIGVAYRQVSDYDNAIDYLKKASRNNYSNKTKTYLNIAKTYHMMNLQDSATIYAEKALKLAKEEDLSVFAGIYITLSQIEEQNLNDKQALTYYKAYTDKLERILDENESREILELQKKYKYEQFVNENNILKIKQQKLFLIFAIVILICFFIVFFFYRRNVKNEKMKLEKENEILEAKNKIFQLIKMSQSYNEREKSFRNILLQHFEILSKAATLEKYKKGDSEQDDRMIKIFNEIVYGQASLNWNKLYNTMNEIHNQLFDRLQLKYPKLDDCEFRVCCLTYTGFSCDEISVIVGLSVSTIQMKRASIRKKLGIETGGKIQAFLDSNL